MHVTPGECWVIATKILTDDVVWVLDVFLRDCKGRNNSGNANGADTVICQRNYTIVVCPI